MHLLHVLSTLNVKVYRGSVYCSHYVIIFSLISADAFWYDKKFRYI